MMTVLTIGHEKGGVGKSRLATQLAVLATCNGVDTILLDTDVQGTATEWCQIRKSEGIDPPVSVLSISRNPEHEIQDLSKRYALIVIDVGAQDYETFLKCAVVSDLVLVPLGPDQGELSSTMKVFRELRSKDRFHPKGRIDAHALLLKVSHLPSHRFTQELRDVLEGQGIHVMNTHIPSREAWKAAGRAGRALHELRGGDQSPKATLELQDLYDEILALVNQ